MVLAAAAGEGEGRGLEARFVRGLKRYFDPLLTAYQLLADALAVGAGFLLAFLLYQLTVGWVADFVSATVPFLRPSGEVLTAEGLRHTLYVLVGLPPLIYVPIFWIFGLYRREMSIMNVAEVQKIVSAVPLGFILFIASLFLLLGTLPISRLILAYSLPCVYLVMLSQRMVFYRLHLHYHSKGLGVHRVLVYGAGQTGRHLARKLLRFARLGYHPVGFIDDDPDKQGQRVPVGSAGGAALPVLGSFEDIPRFVEWARIHHIFVAVPSLSPARNLELIRLCNSLGIGFSVIPSLYNLIVQQTVSNEIDGIPLITFQGPRYRSAAQAMKRAFDLVFATTMMFLLSPLLLALAVAVRLDSQGPSFFSHTRIGRDGKPFFIHKFRSMYVGVPPHGVNPTDPSDPRVTRVGAVLRRFSLDELPQFINVMKGEMSTVGPRPEMPFLVDLYDDYQRQRLNVTPGVTGLWQISEDRAGEIHANMDYDIYYIENQSFLLDLIIIVATTFFAVRGKGAL